MPEIIEFEEKEVSISNGDYEPSDEDVAFGASQQEVIERFNANDKFDTKYPSEESKEWHKRCGNCENQNLNYDEVPCIYCKYNEYTKTADMWKPEK